MCSVLPIKSNLVTNVQNYLNCSYNLGYDLDAYFSKNQQITMFEKLLSCDATFKQEWESGEYYIPEDRMYTMHMSSYTKKQSSVKKLSRKISNYTFNNKLTEGAKNLLQAYMIKNSQEYSQEGKDRNMNTRTEEMFCGIFKNINDRKESYIDKIAPNSDLKKEITSYLSGGTKRKHMIKKHKSAFKKKKVYKNNSTKKNHRRRSSLN